MRRRTTTQLAKALGVNVTRWNAREQQAFSNFALELSLVPEIKNWSAAEKQAIVAIIRAKAGPDETRYLRLLQKHETLRTAFLRIGSEKSKEVSS